MLGLQYPWDVSAADLDGDTDIDLLSASHSNGTIRWYENNGSGVFTNHTLTSSFSWAAHAEAADLDGDGDNDIIIAKDGIGSISNPVAWSENLSGGNFGPVQNLSTQGLGVSRMQFSDIDNDNDLDVIVDLLTASLGTRI